MNKQEGDMRACELWKGKGKGREGKGKCNYKLIKKLKKILAICKQEERK